MKNKPIVRIVRMTFRPEATEAFQSLYDQRKDRISQFEGCRHLELWQDTKELNVFFTYSIWDSEACLDHYRYSSFFKDTWTQTRALFSARPEAWTLNRLAVNPE